MRPPSSSELARVLAILALAFWTSLPHPDPDLWGHLVYGEAALTYLAPLAVDRYSYTCTGRAWVNHEWYAEAVLAALATGPGMWALYAFNALVALALFAHAARRRASAPRTEGLAGSSALVALALAMVAAGLAPSFSYRPQTFSFAAFYLMLLCIGRARASGRARDLAPLVPLFALWANLHGGFVAGLCVLAVATATTAVEAVCGRRPWRPAVASAAVATIAAAATVATPYGPSLWSFLAFDLGRDRPMITEWGPPAWSLAPDALDELARGGALAGLGLLFAARRRPRDPFAALLVVVTTYVWLRHQRHLPFLALAVLWIAPAPTHGGGVEHGSPEAALDPTTRGRRAVRALLALSCATLVALASIVGSAGTMIPTTEYPVAAMRVLAGEELGGRLLVHYDWSQYAIHRLFPRWRVAYDGRYTTVYPLDLEDRFMAWQRPRANGWRRMFEEEPRPDAVLLPALARTASWMKARAGWVVVYEDATAILLVRPNHPLRAALEARARALGAAGELDVALRVPFPG